MGRAQVACQGGAAEQGMSLSQQEEPPGASVSAAPHCTAPTVPCTPLLPLHLTEGQWTLRSRSLVWESGT